MRDRNFRGLGEQFEILVSAFKEGVEKGVGDLPPSYRISWVDGISGRPSSMRAGIDADHSIESMDSFFPSSKVSL